MLWFDGLTVLWFSGFMVLWFYGFLVSKIPKCHVICSGIYRSHIQDVQDFFTRIFTICRCPPFPTFTNKWCPTLSKNANVLDFQNVEIYEHNIPKKGLCFSWIVQGIMGSQKINNIGFGSRRHVQKFRNHRNDGFWVLP